MNLNKLLLIVPITLSLFSCGAGSQNSENINSQYAPETELEEVFESLKENNFTMSYEDSLVNLDNMIRRATYSYTKNSVQAEGYHGFFAYAEDEKNDVVFKYNIVDGEIVAGAPLVSSYDGLRYESLYDFTYGFEDFDISYLPKTKDEEGYYHYEFNRNEYNDTLIKSIFNRVSGNSIDPVSLKMKVVKNILTVETVLIDNYLDPTLKDTIVVTIYNIGKTTNPEIEKYLQDGKTSKDPLDMKFYKLMNSYLGATNYTVEVYNDEINESKKILTEYCTSDAIYDVTNSSQKGYLKTQGAVVSYEVVNDKVNILSTPIADQYNNFYTEIFGNIIYYSFSDITYDVLVGYKDEKNDNLYHITDTYFIYILGYLCYLDIDETNYASEALIEITGENEFVITLNTFNKSNNLKVVSRICKFYDLNEVELPFVDEYLSLGDDASKQSKNDLQAVLNKISSHNYSLDILSGSGLAKAYMTENYYYQEIYGSPNTNFGYIKIGESIREFTIIDSEIIIDETKDYASGSNPLSIPSHGTILGYDMDLSYISTFEGIYNIDNYDVETIGDLSFWSIRDNEVALDLYNYVWYGIKGIYPYASGFVVSNNGEDSKLSLIAAYVLEDGSYKGYESFTYYDIGNTSYELLDNYLANL